MAHPIRLNVVTRDPREELMAQLQEAPAQHAEAILAAYKLLQGMHDRKIFDLLSGMLNAGDQISESVVDALTHPEAIKAIRNLIILGKMTASIDPELLGGIASAVQSNLERAQALTREPPGLVSLMSQFAQKDARRSMTLLSGILKAVGQVLAKPQPTK
jgi:uncharacterized protein YjgD (DUF1641 family)